MKLIAFTKMIPEGDARKLLRLAASTGVEGYDLCVRDGYFIQPDNAETTLPSVVKELRSEGIAVPMVTGEGIWRGASDPTSEHILAAMSKAGVGLYKTGYRFYRPNRDGDYGPYISAFRRDLAEWAKLAVKHGVKVCYHTHCDMPGLALGYHVGTNCAEVMHILQDFDPSAVGAYIGTGNLIASGEPFEYGLAMLKPYLSIVELQDMFLERVQVGDEGSHRRHWTTAGNGAVGWSRVFQSLVACGFEGPLTMHAEFEVPPGQSFEDLLTREVAYFRNKRDSALRARASAPPVSH